MNKALVLMQLFCKGQEIGSAAQWKSGQIAANQLAGLVILLFPALNTLFGLHLPNLDDQQSLIIATAALTVLNCIITVITSAKVGLPAHWFGAQKAVEADQVAAQQ